MTEKKLLLRALDREPLPRPPVWLMRQAGRYLPEYQEVRKQAGGFLELAKDPELAAEVTLQPIRRFGMDGAIIFSDILLPLEAMGMPLVFDERGPSLPEPLRSLADVEKLSAYDPAVELGYVGEALKRTAAGLPSETTLLGFCGAPFTLASYAIEGGTGKSFLHLRHLMYHEPEAWELLMTKLTDAVADHLAYQITSGAEAVVLFDTWAAALTVEDYRRYAKPWSQKVLDRLRGKAPRVAFAGAADHLVEELASLRPDGVAIDYRTDIKGAFDRVGSEIAIQGNLDPGALLSTPEEVTRRTRELLERVAGRPGHVLNLGHGVFKTTDPACVGAFVDAAKEYRHEVCEAR